MSDRLSGHILNSSEQNANELFNQQSVYDLHIGLSRVAYWRKSRVKQEKEDYAAKKSQSANARKILLVDCGKGRQKIWKSL